MNETLHDPGGKVRLAIQAGMGGKAEFSPCGRYRHALTRSWGGPADPWALWIGMNPSTADGTVDDPTVRREIIYTRDRLGLGGLWKCNVMDYRATDPKRLREPGVVPCSDINGGHILDRARRAKIVIAAWGALPAPLRHHAEFVRTIMNVDGIELWCLGFTQDGSPRHPLYVRGDTELVRYPRER